MKFQLKEPTEAEKKNMEYARQLGLEGDPSLHPKYPTDRVLMDAYAATIGEENVYVWHLCAPAYFYRGNLPRLLPSRVPVPYGKPISIMIDASILWNQHGRRPGLDFFLSRVFEKYEILLYGDEARFFV